MNHNSKNDIYCVCNPLIDLLLHVKTEDLQALKLEKNTMSLSDDDRQAEILGFLEGKKIAYAPGGSGANTAVLFSQLGGKSAFNGKVAEDERGQIFVRSLEDYGVHSCIRSAEGVTGSTVILIAEDASRTMNTNLGICQEFSENDLDLDSIAQSKMIYLTGYCWDTDLQKKAVLRALRYAEEKSVRTVLSLSDPFCVQRHKDDFLRLLEGHTDIALMNLDEAKIVTGETSVEMMIEKLKSMLDHFVITKGKDGSVIYHEGKVYEIPCRMVTAIDTTGAGDSYAAAYLYGLSQNFDVEKAGKLASFFSAEVVSMEGARLETDVSALFQKFLDENPG